MALKHANLLGRKWLDGASISRKMLSSRQGSWHDISQLILWNYLHKGHLDMNLDPPFLYNHWNNNEETNWFVTRKLLSSTQGSEMISPNSFCGFIFTRAIHMNLDPPFLYNLPNKNEETNLIYYSEMVEIYTKLWNDISQLILWLYLHKGHRYGLRPPNPAKSLNKNEQKQFDSSTERCWVPESSLKNRLKHI